MQTLSFGYKKPETGDRGTVFFPALEDNIDRLNSHDHDGVNSAPLTAQSITAVVQDIVSGGWVSIGNGLHKQSVTCPGTIEFEKQARSFMINSGSDANNMFFPLVTKLTANTYEVTVNDSSIDVRIFYT